MSDFYNTRTALQQKRDACERSRQVWYTQKELLRLQERKIQYRLRQESIITLPTEDADQQLLRTYLAEVVAKREDLEQLESEVQALETALDALGVPQIVTGELNDELPVLLLPLRVQTRFVTVRHLAAGLSRAHCVDVSQESKNEFLQNLPERWQRDLQEGTLLEMPTLSSISYSKDIRDRTWAGNIGRKVKKKELTTAKNNWLKAVPDTSELWVRIYPDDIFVHSHEPHLTPQELKAGQNFWDRWWEIHAANPNAFEEEFTDSNSLKPLTAVWAELQTSFRAARAAWIFRQSMPSNYAGKNTDYRQPPSFDAKSVRLKSEPWTEPVLSFVLPDRLVVKLVQGKLEKEFTGNRIPHPLRLSPSPEQGATLEEVKWLRDFEEAEKMGLALRINLPEEGFRTTELIDKLIVLGVKASVDEQEGKVLLEKLFENHHYKGNSLAILPQGTPTNNFEEVRSGYSSEGLPAEEVFKITAGAPLFRNQSDWKDKKDGQYLSDALGISPTIFEHIQHSDGRDIMGALAMNRLLWPATMGYYLQQFLQYSLQPPDLENAREFFSNYVSGRGFLPVLRVDKQPYGIITATAFSKWAFRETDARFLRDLFDKVLQPLDTHWSELAQKVKQLSDPALALHKYSEEFVHILGLCASSKTFYRRPQLGKVLLENAIGADLQTKPTTSFGGNFFSDPVINKMKEGTKPFYRPDLAKEWRKLNIKLKLVESTSYPNDRILQQHFSNLYQEYRGPIIDPLPASEKRRLSDWHGRGKNYLEWLEEANYQTLRDEYFPVDPPDSSKPSPLFYLLARQALSRAYLEAAVSLLPKKKDISLIDFELEHLTELPLTDFGEEQIRLLNISRYLSLEVFSEYLYDKNKWSYLSEKTPVTGPKTTGTYIEEQPQEFPQLAGVKSALACLQDSPTAELERLFSEHLDLCSYRLDSWMYGLVQHRLETQRRENPQGVYLGAYGYLEKLDPSKGKDKIVFRVLNTPEVIASPAEVDLGKVVAPVLNISAFSGGAAALNELLSNAFLYLGFSEGIGFVRSADDREKIVAPPAPDVQNQGFIHTPGHPHAVAAAILRSGFLANNPTRAHDEFAVNLSSARVRKALHLIEGMRNGQELPALLGYQLERALHDAGLDAYIADLRTAFPLRSKRHSVASDGEPDEVLEASNVLNGLDLLNFYRIKDRDIDQLLMAKSIAVSRKWEVLDLKEAIEHLDQHLDAVSDLLIAESVYQAAKGNLGRSAAVLKMLNNDSAIEIPEIIATPKKGKLLSHLVGVQFDLSPKEVAWPGVHSPRSTLQPAFNHWLAAQLPSPKQVGISLLINGESKRLQLENIGIQPIDLITFFQGKDVFALSSELTYFITKVAWKFFQAGPADDIQVLYKDRTDLPATWKTLYEIKPLLDNLLIIWGSSRPLLPHDLQLPSQAQPLDPEAYTTLDLSSLMDGFRTIAVGTGPLSINKVKNNLKSWQYECVKSRTADFPVEKAQFNYEVLQRLLMETAYYCAPDQDYQAEPAFSPERRDALLQKTERAITHFGALETKAKALFSVIESLTNPLEKWKGLCSLAELIFGSSLKLYPSFRLHNPQEVASAIHFLDLLAEAGEDACGQWLQDLSRVRPKMKAYKKLALFREVYRTPEKEKDLKIIQLPYQTDTENYRWLGAEFPPRIKISGDVKSIALELPGNFQADQWQAGFIIDSWTERIQEQERDTAIALHYDQANAEPPQSILLAVSPQLTGNWTWKNLMLTVVETIEMAKKRAVEPAMLEEDTAEYPPNVHYMPGHPLKFLLPALSVPVSNTKQTPAIRFDKHGHNF